MIEIRMKNDNEYFQDRLIELKEIEDLDEMLYSHFEYMMEQAFDEFLDDLEDAVILGFHYATSQALKATDPEQYRATYLEYWDAELSEARDALKRGDTYRMGSVVLSVES